MAATLEDLVTDWKAGAFIYVMDRNGTVQTVRPAAFVWATADGIEWVEPSYADPWGSPSPSFHERRGTWPSFNVVETADQLVEAMPFDPEFDSTLPGAEALLWYAKHLEREKIDWAEERARVRAILDQDRATAA